MPFNVTSTLYFLARIFKHSKMADIQPHTYVPTLLLSLQVRHKTS
jgi:hypothetical protein